MMDLSNNKTKRKLEYHWEILRNGENYFILTTIEDIKRYALGPRIKLNDRELFLNEKAQSNLIEFVNLISKAPKYKKVLTYNTIYNVCLDELQSDIKRITENKNTIGIDQLINEINKKMSQEQDAYIIYSVLVGLNLEDMQEVKLGNSSIVRFTEELKWNIIDEQYKLSSKDAKLYGDFIDKNFLGKVCFKHVIIGDYDNAKKISRLLSREILNYFRFFICFLAHDATHENPIKLRLEEEYISNSERYLALPSKSTTPVISWGIGLQNLTPFPFTHDRLKELKDNLFFDEFIELIWANKRNALDGIIITAIHWIGEAQNEYDFDAAFLKFWTSIESIFSKGYSKNITENLAKSVSILIAFSDYRFIGLNDHYKIYRAVKKLYSIRSKIIHVGLRYSVKAENLNEVCKYASWAIASLFCLRSKGYTKVEQISYEIDRLYNILNKDDKKESGL